MPNIRGIYDNMDKVTKAIDALQRGEFILIHDSDDREDETDFVIAAEFVRPEHIAKMRTDGGGLICIALAGETAKKIGLPFYTEIMDAASKKIKVLSHLKANDIPYDEKSSFSLNMNYRGTFTGITDIDRALTIRKFAEFLKNEGLSPEKFGSRFRSPGHVSLLISRGIENRRGHTEFAAAMLEGASLTPVAAICELMDSETHRSLSRDKAIPYAKNNNMVFLEGGEIVRALKTKNKIKPI